MTRPLHADAPRRRAGAPQKQGKQVWLKVYPTDWDGDAALRACSWAAQGVWTRMVHLMVQCEPYGHLALAGAAMTETQIARQLGGDVREIRRLLGELETNGVFSRTADGTIYCRRLVRDRVKSEEGREAAARGWDQAQVPRRSGAARPQLIAISGGATAQLSDSYPDKSGGHIGENQQKSAKNVPDSPNGSAANSGNAYCQNPESRIPPQPPPHPTDPFPRSLRGDAGGADCGKMPLWKRELLRHEVETGKLVCGSYYWDGAMADVAAAARLPEGWRGNWEPLARWLTGTGEQGPRDLADILAAITNRAVRADYEPPHSSLGMFNDAVWSYGRRRR